MHKKSLCKYRQVWSCLEGLVIRKIMVQSKINLDTRLKSYSFFNSDFACMWMMSALLSKSACINKFFPLIYATLKWSAQNIGFGWWFTKSSLQAMYNHAPKRARQIAERATVGGEWSHGGEASIGRLVWSHDTCQVALGYLVSLPKSIPIISR